MRSGRTLLAVAVAAGCTAAAPATALAASATVTNDSGSPVALDGAPTIRNMSPEVGLTFAPAEQRYAVDITGPAGDKASSGVSCRSTASSGPERVAYLGNGTYTVTVRTSTAENDFGCQELGAPQTFGFTIAAFTGVTAPGPRLLTRRPGESALLTYPFGVELNPGADDTELRYARNAAIGPDGGISGTSSEAFVNASTGAANVTFPAPGRYTFVSRASDFSGAATPWSPPVAVTVLAPFDFVSNPFFTDSRGPRYTVTGTVRERTARGKILVSLAKGAKGGKFKKLKKVKIMRGGRFAVTFKLRKQGRHRLQYRYEGNKTVAGGTLVQTIRITRRIFF